MAAYGTVRTLAEILGKTQEADLFERTLDEEKHADSVLTQISDSAQHAGGSSSVVICRDH